MDNSLFGIFSKTILKWREPSGGFDFVFLKEHGIQKIHGRFPDGHPARQLKVVLSNTAQPTRMLC
jgi:hypothetical protein